MAPPLPTPPEIRSQQQPAPSAMGMARAGMAAPGSQADQVQVIDRLGQDLNAFQELMSGIQKQLAVVSPELQVYLGPIAQAGKKLMDEVAQLKQRATGNGGPAAPGGNGNSPNPSESASGGQAA